MTYAEVACRIKMWVDETEEAEKRFKKNQYLIKLVKYFLIPWQVLLGLAGTVVLFFISKSLVSPTD
jgi:hypothetical protein